MAAAEENRSVAFFSFIIGFDDGVPNYSLRFESLSDFLRVIGVGSMQELDAAGALVPERDLDLYRVVELTGETVPELMERCVSAGVMVIAIDELSKLVPRQPIELTNMAQLEGSIQWLSNSVNAVSQSQPGDNLRLPQLDFLDA